MPTITYDEEWKLYRSDDYNYDFNRKTGYFKRWGKTEEDDPSVGSLEIFDLEIDERCEGIPAPGKEVASPCTFCYKSNVQVGRYMEFETFKKIFDKLPPSLMQIAFGIGNISGHPDLFKFFDYCLHNEHNPGVIPNITTNGYGVTKEIAEKIASYGGGVAVSRYENYDVCYDAVKKLTDAGILQVNIHQLISVESLQSCYQVIDDVASDPRLAKVRYILFLTLKPKGKRNKWHVLKNVDEYRKLIEYAWEKGVNIGFDSCSAPTFLASVKDHPEFEQLNAMVEACESTLFSLYGNVNGEAFPCSFTEEERGWRKGVDLTKVNDFEKDVWNDQRMCRFRQANLDSINQDLSHDCRRCVTYPGLYDEKLNYNQKLYDDYISDVEKVEKPPRKIIPIKIVT